MCVEKNINDGGIYAFLDDFKATGDVCTSLLLSERISLRNFVHAKVN
jgi:hypothetical protein